MFFFSERCLKICWRTMRSLCFSDIHKLNSQEHFLSSYRRSYWQSFQHQKRPQTQILLSVKASHSVCHGFSLGLIDISLERSLISMGRDLKLFVKTLFQLVTLNNELLLCFNGALTSLYEGREMKKVYIWCIGVIQNIILKWMYKY